MKKTIICLFMILAICLSGCSFSSSSGNSNSQPEPETVIVKETVVVTETVYVNGSKNEKETQPETTENNSEGSENKGYTTQEVLRRAANASEKQYWILYYWDNGLKMQSFNALEGFTVTLESNQHLKCDRLVGDITLYYWDEKKNDFAITNTTAYGDWGCTDIIGGNVDVFDEKNDKTISAKTN